MKLRCAALLAMCALLLAGCVGSPPQAAVPGGAAQPSSQSHNATDVMFLQMMVPHHGQGLALVRLAKERTHRPEIAMLAAAIESTQASEVERMSGWLRDWGAPPTADAGAHADHGGLPGTSPHEIVELAGAGTDFDARFLNLMIAHQDDAVQLARLEKVGGVNQSTRDLADQIDRSRTAQIQLMLGYLDAGDPSPR